MEIIADFLMKGIAVAKRIQEKSGKQLKDFLPALDEDVELKELSEQVKAFSNKYSIPGI